MEHGRKRKNMKRATNTKRKNSLRQKRKQHIKTGRRNKGNHEEERDAVDNGPAEENPGARNPDNYDPIRDTPTNKDDPFNM